MTSIIETLNQSSGTFFNLAWPIFWQSSLLIVLVFAIEFLLRHKLRSSFRYALWLVVLLKLCLPPTLALPTSPAWWLTKHSAAINLQPVNPHYTITYGDTSLSPIPDAPLPSFVSPPPAITLAAGLMSLSIAVSSALLFWMLFRWHQITQKVRQAFVSERLTQITNEARNICGLKRKVRIRVTTDSMSPAVCGLFRPTILIPESLANHFSDDQLRAVLLHELIHLRRCDVWLNFAQTLLQILYWWHPFVWLGNARIRRVREEAVDDAVMLALQDRAESYAPTLLEVARLALNRPLASLGLIGILESRHSLRQRIERLIDFRPPRHTGLTLLSFMGILTFTAVAVPMGQAPVKETPSSASESVIAEKSPQPAPTQITITAQFYWLTNGAMDNILRPHRRQQTEKSTWTFPPDQWTQIKNSLASSGYTPFSVPRVTTFIGCQAELFCNDDTNRIDLKCLPYLQGNAIELALEGSQVEHFQSITSSNHFSAQVSAVDHGGFVLQTKDDASSSNLVIVVSVQFETNHITATAPPLSTNPTQVSKTNQVPVFGFVADPYSRVALHAQQQRTGSDTLTEPEVTTYNLRRQNQVNIQKVLQNLTDGSNSYLTGNRPENEKTDPAFDGLVSTNEISTKLFTRVFNVDAYAFRVNLRFQPPSVTNISTAALKTLISEVGVDWDSPAGKTLVYNDGAGLVYVKATESDLDAIAHLFETLNQVTPQVHLKARFYLVPHGTLETYQQSLKLTNSTDGNLFGILTSEEADTIRHTLVSSSDFEDLAEPEVTLLSGHQVHMHATRIINVVTNLAYVVGTTNEGIKPQTGTVETGPIIDIIPFILSDGYTVNMVTVASVTDFLGYDKHSKTKAAYTTAGDQISLPDVAPHFSMQQSIALANLWDGQTLVLGKFQPVHSAPPFAGQETTTKDILVFVTVNLTDQAGNLFHLDTDLPFAKNSIPVQPAQVDPAMLNKLEKMGPSHPVIAPPKNSSILL